MAPSASTDEVRRAYHARARALHPDRFATAPTTDASRAASAMQDVNEAWRVLRDPARRLAYDRSLAAARRPAAAAAPPRPARADDDDDLVDVAPSVTPGWAQVVKGVPWAVLLVVLAVIFVFTAYASTGRDGDDPVGGCVTVASGSAAGTVPCGTAGARRVQAVVEPQRACPPGTARIRWGDDGTGVCVA